MAKRQKNTFEKRQREQLKRMKAEDKRARRIARKATRPLIPDSAAP